MKLNFIHNVNRNHVENQLCGSPKTHLCSTSLRFRGAPLPSLTKSFITSNQRGHAKCARIKPYAQNVQNIAAGANDSKEGQVVIVGGGPAGMGAALMLAKRGWKNITLLEKRSSAKFYEPEKSYCYMIDGRGQQFTDYMNFTKDLAEVGVASSETSFNRILSDGAQTKFPLDMSGAKRDGYWIPRRDVLALMAEQLQKYSDNVQVQYNANSVEINLDQNQERIEISYLDESKTSHKIQPTLLIGCDGANSIVREKLHQDSGKKKFQLQEFQSPAAGLRFKILTIPPDFVLNKETGEKAISSLAYAFKSVSSAENISIGIGCLPQKDPHSPRTANFIAKPSHHIWTLKTGEQFLKFLEEQFPLVPIKEQVPMEELDRVARSKGGKFPASTYSDGVSQQFGDNGVVLLGDSLHFFPPDLGQGVNSAFEDVMVLKNALEKCDDRVADSLALFEQMRLEDSKNLAKLVQVVAPYQYSQDQFGSSFWLFTVAVESFANKILPAVFSGPTFFKMSDPDLSYTEIWNIRAENNGKLRFAGVLAASAVLTPVVLTLKTVLA
eukprot:TRINITY_DN4328_c0_g1_i7.p1 TRINITY_DN4328_c0_g1~~TRINITY_DN4328_c0_g1_i7.p1  ORF type:complete len:553 (-),score=100.16 TRINITY_DN4328_c0_g1_i7:1215-2873(-)